MRITTHAPRGRWGRVAPLLLTLALALAACGGDEGGDPDEAAATPASGDEDTDAESEPEPEAEETEAEEPAAEPDLVRFGLLSGGLTVLPAQRLADDPELQERYGLQVETRNYANLQELFPGMAAGDFDATLATASGIGALDVRGAPVSLIATGVNDDSVVLLGMGDPITDAEQLRGARVTALASAGTWRVMKAQIEERFGLEDGDFEVISVNNLVAGATQVAAGTADYALAWEPFVTAAQNQIPGMDIVLRASELKDYSSWQLVVGVHGDMSDDLVERITAALAESSEWLHAEPAQADEDYRELLDYEPGVIESVLGGDLYAFDIHRLTPEDVDSIKRDLELTVQQGGLESLPEDDFYR